MYKEPIIVLNKRCPHPFPLGDERRPQSIVVAARLKFPTGVHHVSSQSMPKRTFTTIDGNEAVAHVAYHISEVIVIYPITPSSPIGEPADAWSSAGKPSIWGTVPSVVETQSEGGAAGAVPGPCRPAR